jgi:hypothetical protein
MPDVVPVWSIELSVGDDERAVFPHDEAANRALITMLREMGERKGRDVES